MQLSWFDGPAFAGESPEVAHLMAVTTTLNIAVARLGLLGHGYLFPAGTQGTVVEVDGPCYKVKPIDRQFRKLGGWVIADAVHAIKR